MGSSLCFMNWYAGGGANGYGIPVANFDSTTWYHICQCRQGMNFYNFVNGKLVDSFSTNKNLLNGGLYGGTSMYIALTDFHYQCIKFSTIARYTEDFTPSKPW